MKKPKITNTALSKDKTSSYNAIYVVTKLYLSFDPTNYNHTVTCPSWQFL